MPEATESRRGSAGTAAEEPADVSRAQGGWQGHLSMLLVMAGAAFAMTPWCTPQIALALGIGLALVGLVPRALPAQELARFLIQISVVLLGFRMDLREVAAAGTEGVLFAIGTIALVFALGEVIRRMVGVERDVSTLISSGTAICGGSAIAAVGSTIRASSSAMAVSLATVFILNGIALWVFPWAGRAMGLTALEFGTWAGVAIHDVSSVVGAGAEYDRITGDEAGTALATATVVKLSRVIWIVPVVMVVAWWYGRGATDGTDKRRGMAVPWFVVLFLVAAALHTLAPEIREKAAQIEGIARVQMRLALFLIGTGLSVAAIRSVGWRALVQGIVLWLVLSGTALLVVRLAV